MLAETLWFSFSFWIQPLQVVQNQFISLYCLWCCWYKWYLDHFLHRAVGLSLPIGMCRFVCLIKYGKYTMATTLGAIWGSVSCSRTLGHTDCRVGEPAILRSVSDRFTSWASATKTDLFNRIMMYMYHVTWTSAETSIKEMKNRDRWKLIGWASNFPWLALFFLSILIIKNNNRKSWPFYFV